MFEKYQDVLQNIEFAIVSIYRENLEMPITNPTSLDEIIQCLKRILKFVEKWNKHEDIQGYLRFVSQYVR
jgi:hypothetical protein